MVFSCEYKQRPIPEMVFSCKYKQRAVGEMFCWESLTEHRNQAHHVGRRCFLGTHSAVVYCFFEQYQALAVVQIHATICRGTRILILSNCEATFTITLAIEKSHYHGVGGCLTCLIEPASSFLNPFRGCLYRPATTSMLATLWHLQTGLMFMFFLNQCKLQCG